MEKQISIILTLFAVFAVILACGCTSNAKTAEEGNTVYVQYKGTYNNGTIFDESEEGDPIVFTLGEQSMISGFEDAVYGMKIGDSKNIHLTPDQAYGYYNPELVFTVDRDQISGGTDLQGGEMLYMYGSQGEIYTVRVLSITNDTVELDPNHQMAGEELNFEITLVNIE